MNDRKLEVYNGTDEVIGLRYEVINSGVPIGMMIGVTIAMATTIGFIWGYAVNNLHKKKDAEFDTTKSGTGNRKNIKSLDN
jgi:hypothetical protein